MKGGNGTVKTDPAIDVGFKKFMTILSVAALVLLSATMGYVVGNQTAYVDMAETRIERGHQESAEAEQRRLIVQEVMTELKVHGVIK